MFFFNHLQSRYKLAKLNRISVSFHERRFELIMISFTCAAESLETVVEAQVGHSGVMGCCMAVKLLVCELVMAG